MIFPSRRSLSTSAAFARGAFRVTTGRRRPASASEIARAKSAIVEEYAPRYALPPSTRSFAVTSIASDPGATATNRPPGPSRDRPRSNVPFVPTKSMATIVCEISKRGRRFGWTHCQVSAGVESRFPCLRPELDCHYAGVVCLRDLNRGQADTARPDDDDDIVLIRLSEGDNCTVRGSAAAPEGSGQG